MAVHNPLASWRGGIMACALLLFGSSAYAADEAKANDSDAMLSQADALQYGHKFDQALALLERLIADDQHVQQARLMQARILLAQGRINAAQQSCAALMGTASLSITGTCLLEVKSRAAHASGDRDVLQTTYVQLQRIAMTTAAKKAAPEIFAWQRQVLAEQAFLLGEHQQSNDWLNYSAYAEHPTVNQLRIIDNWLALGQPKQLFTQHSSCPEVGQLPEDSIIVRLAAAEQRLATKRKTKAQCWQQLAAERIAIRVARADPLHTSDLAYYFVHVAPDAERAQLYAELNYAVAREPADQRLRVAAQNLRESSHEH